MKFVLLLALVATMAMIVHGNYFDPLDSPYYDRILKRVVYPKREAVPQHQYGNANVQFRNRVHGGGNPKISSAVVYNNGQSG